MVAWILVGTVGCLVLLLYLGRNSLGFGSNPETAIRQGIRSMVADRHAIDEEADELQADTSNEDGDDEGVDRFTIRATDNRLTLQKRLKYGRLTSIPPWVFSVGQIVLSVVVFLLVRLRFGLFLQLLSLMTGPLIVNGFINYRVNARFKKFDKDYPQFLRAFIGMLKTGLNPLQALEAAGINLDDDSLVRQEVELMLERLRMGVSEERSIGTFGDDINHAEIELFVQALLLSRRVGGNLSETIERLARQVRKRQHFRASAEAAVGLQRGSLYAILALLVGLEFYLYFAWPECVVIAWTDPTAAPVAEFGAGMILIGSYWMLKVTKIRV